MTVKVHLSGEDFDFKREVSESTARQIIEISMDDGGIADESQLEPEDKDVEEQTVAEDDDVSSLPNDFFKRLSSKQDALIRVLNDADEPILSTELQRRMEENYDEPVGGGRGVAGILQGFSKKHGDDFDLIKIDWDGEQGYYQFNPDRPEYINEIEEYFED